MTTYIYETIPQKSGPKPKRYEIRQSMKESPLTTHPETGEPIRRVMMGGFGVMGSKAAEKPTAGGGSCCGAGCGCH